MIYNPSSSPAALAATTFDVVIYGATWAGINAAVTASSQGARVALVEPTGLIGGVSTYGSLTNLDIWTPNQIGGLAWQQIQQMFKLEGTNGTGQPSFAAASGNSASAGYVNQAVPGMLTPQPKTVQAVLSAWLKRSGAVVILNAPLTTTGGTVAGAAIMRGQTIAAISTAAGVISGKAFIDCSYEGDLLASVAMAGAAQYTFGRESSAQYGESYGGSMPGATQTVTNVSMLDGNGNPIYPLVANPNITAGAADSYVQSATVRTTVALISGGAKAFSPPPGYNPATYNLPAAVATAKGLTTLASVLVMYPLNGSKWDVNDGNGAGNELFSLLNRANGLPDATPSQRKALAQEHLFWRQGLLYALASHTGMPAALRTDAAKYGYPADEYTDNAGTPRTLYMREGRRMVGKYIMTQSDLLTNKFNKTTTICHGSYVLDSKACITYVTGPNSYVSDGGTYDTSSAAWQIPMESIIPAAGQCPNLIVPVCCSTSHVAWMGTRMEVTFAMQGEAAGLIAAIAAKNSVSVQSINYATQLQSKLTAIGALIS